MAFSTPPEKWWQFRLENAGITKLGIYKDGAILNVFNDLYHLPEELRR